MFFVLERGYYLQESAKLSPTETNLLTSVLKYIYPFTARITGKLLPQVRFFFPFFALGIAAIPFFCKYTQTSFL